jgi:hypothetical protein
MGARRTAEAFAPDERRALFPSPPAQEAIRSPC